MAFEEFKQRRRKERYLYALTSVCFSGKSAYYFAVNQQFKMSMSKMRGVLEQWEIHEEEQLKPVLDNLLKSGSREEFTQLQNYLSIIPEESRREAIEAMPDEKEESRKRADFTNRYLRRVSPRNIAALDYAYCILLSRYGMKLGYMEPDEAEEYMIKAARLAQASYSSWVEYATAYIIGVQFVDCVLPQKSPPYLSIQKPTIRKLFASRHSPLQKIDWNTEI
ncbi:DUF1266 domain-containing protein [Pseudobacillus badius]|uniref:DUF1266 domain-containing protein n=1 Tax=Bacillus badius TaxID=1455 RepID=UPI0007B3D48E|nr:DUF1266 domain-containing protein [Bacillus badius]KZR56862.1 hypothetical protein A3781_06295 [Bacillus badius]GLY10829.1 hypothetical protein Bbad01_20450 [Bacillus badius]